MGSGLVVLGFGFGFGLWSGLLTGEAGGAAYPSHGVRARGAA
jgi:hypothetical protein